jgi:hypothetical protein
MIKKIIFLSSFIGLNYMSIISSKKINCIFNLNQTLISKNEVKKNNKNNNLELLDIIKCNNKIYSIKIRPFTNIILNILNNFCNIYIDPNLDNNKNSNECNKLIINKYNWLKYYNKNNTILNTDFTWFINNNADNYNFNNKLFLVSPYYGQINDIELLKFCCYIYTLSLWHNLKYIIQNY